jgi:uncharacterized membrane protein YhiD involved in acid resistance
VASIGMAVGGGLYLTAIFATLLILLCLLVLGKTEKQLGWKTLSHVYEVAGSNLEEVTAEVNRLLEPVHGIMENVKSAATRQHVRLQFELVATTKDQDHFLRTLQQSSILTNAVSLGPVYPE